MCILKNLPYLLLILTRSMSKLLGAFPKHLSAHVGDWAHHYDQVREFTNTLP